MFWFKKIRTPVSNETKETTVIQLWMVKWSKRYGEFSGSTIPVVEAFTSKEAAEEFKESLVAAYALLKHTSGTRVELYKN